MFSNRSQSPMLITSQPSHSPFNKTQKRQKSPFQVDNSNNSQQLNRFSNNVSTPQLMPKFPQGNVNEKILNYEVDQKKMQQAIQKLLLKSEQEAKVILQLKSENFELNDQIAYYQKVINTERKQGSDSELQKFKKQEAQLLQKNQKLQKNQESLQAQLNEALEELSNANSTIKEINASNTQYEKMLQDEIKDKNTQIKALNDKIDKLEENFQAKTKQILSEKENIRTSQMVQIESEMTLKYQQQKQCYDFEIKKITKQLELELNEKQKNEQQMIQNFQDLYQQKVRIEVQLAKEQQNLKDLGVQLEQQKKEGEQQLKDKEKELSNQFSKEVDEIWQSQILKLEQEIRERNMEVEEKVKHNLSVQKQCEDLRKKLAQEKEDFQAFKVNNEKEYCRLQTNLKENFDKLNDQDAEILALKQQLEESQQENQELQMLQEQQEEEHEQKNTQMKGEIERLRFCLKEKEDFYQSLKAQTDKTIKDLAEENEKVSEKLDLHQKQCFQEKFNLENKVKFLGAVAEELKLEKERLCSEVTTCRQEKEELEEEASKLKASHTKDKHQFESAQDCKSLFKDLVTQLKNKISESEKKIQGYQLEIESLYNDNHEQEDNIGTLKKQFTLEKQKLDQNMQVLASKLEQKLFQSNHYSFREQHIQNIMEEWRVEKEQMDKQFQKQLQDKDNEYQKMQEQFVDEYDELNKQLQIEYYMQQQMQIQDLEFKYQAQIQSLTEQTVYQQRKIDEIAELNNNLEEIQKDKDKIIFERYEELELLKTKFNNLNKSYIQLENIQVKFEQTKDQQSYLEEELLKIQYEKQTLENQLQRSQSERDKKQFELEKAQEQIKHYINDNENCIKQMEQLRQDVNKANQLKMQFEQQEKQSQTQLLIIKKEVSSYKSDISQLNRKIEALQNDLDKCNSELKNKKFQMSDLQERLDGTVNFIQQQSQQTTKKSQQMKKSISPGKQEKLQIKNIIEQS